MGMGVSAYVYIGEKAMNDYTEMATYKLDLLEKILKMSL